MTLHWPRQPRRSCRQGRLSTRTKIKGLFLARSTMMMVLGDVTRMVSTMEQWLYPPAQSPCTGNCTHVKPWHNGHFRGQH